MTQVIPLARMLACLFIICGRQACQQNGTSSGGSFSNAASNTEVKGMQISKDPFRSGYALAIEPTASGSKYREGYLIGGRKHGQWLQYYTQKGKEEIVETITNYHEGRKYGFYFAFDDKGLTKEKAHYANDVLEGERILFERYKIRERAHFKAGQLHGERKLYYGTGEVQEQGFFKNGKRDGMAKWYNELGEMTIAFEYKNGEKIEK